MLNEEEESYHLVGLLPIIKGTEEQYKSGWVNEKKIKSFILGIDTILKSTIDPSEK